MGSDCVPLPRVPSLKGSMPTKNPTPHVKIDFLQLLTLDALDEVGVRQKLHAEYERLRFGGLDSREQWLAVFHPGRTDLSTLPIGILDQKFVVLPRCQVPKTALDLDRFCRRLIDMGEDRAHLHLVVSGWPDGLTLEQHVDALWSLSGHNQQLYGDIVRGRHGRALCRLEGPTPIGAFALPDLWAMIVRQGLLWCAFDAQWAAARARASFAGPLGKLLSVSLGSKDAETVIKPATVLRLMRLTAPILRKTLADHLPREQRREGEENLVKPRGTIAKTIHQHAEKWIAKKSRTIAEHQAELDEVIPYLSSLAAGLPEFIDRLERYRVDQLNRDRAPGRAVESNGLFLLHAIWNSNLSPTEGLAVALFRYAMAERLMKEMVGAAIYGMSASGIQKTVNPLPSLPRDAKELRAIRRRVFDLLDSARRVQLRDEGWRSVDKIAGSDLRQRLTLDPKAKQRHSHQRGGWSVIGEAQRFLTEMGRRERNPRHPRYSDDDRHRTFWHLDVVPELRLFL